VRYAGSYRQALAFTVTFPAAGCRNITIAFELTAGSGTMYDGIRTEVGQMMW
jgi:hypothetical protein